MRGQRREEQADSEGEKANFEEAEEALGPPAANIKE
jgi:hypothetical protein